MTSTNDLCTPCDLPFAAQNQTSPEVDSCPVCFTEEGLRKINGCGHPICDDCDNNLKRNNGQYTETPGLSVKYIKCPLCRQYEKKTYEQLEAEVAYYNCRTPINRSVPTVLTLDEQIRLAEERINEATARRDLLIAREPNPELRAVLQTEAARADTSGASEITEETRTAARALVARGEISTVDLDVNEPTIIEPQIVFIRALKARQFHLLGLNRLTDRSELDAISRELVYIQRNWRYATRAYFIEEQRAQQERNARRSALAVERDTARRFAAAGVAQFQSARPRIRCSGYGLGCDTPAPTQRRCPNHANTACCRRCNTCTVCRGRE